MNMGTIELIAALAVVVSALAVLGMCVIGLLVWLAGSERRPVAEQRGQPGEGKSPGLTV